MDQLQTQIVITFAQSATLIISFSTEDAVNVYFTFKFQNFHALTINTTTNELHSLSFKCFYISWVYLQVKEVKQLLAVCKGNLARLHIFLKTLSF